MKIQIKHKNRQLPKSDESKGDNSIWTKIWHIPVRCLKRRKETRRCLKASSTREIILIPQTFRSFQNLVLAKQCKRISKIIGLQQVFKSFQKKITKHDKKKKRGHITSVLKVMILFRETFQTIRKMHLKQYKKNIKIRCHLTEPV